MEQVGVNFWRFLLEEEKVIPPFLRLVGWHGYARRWWREQAESGCNDKKVAEHEKYNAWVGQGLHYRND
ncbi:MAG: hypothetical protein WBS20_10155 [Lysobacterales bacterium]